MTLGWWHRSLAAVLRTVYFGRVPVRGHVPERRAAGAPPRLVLASHRNGAIDGFPVLAAFPGVQFLVSVQLVRNPLMRTVFTGIPVVRPKDVERYGLDPASVADPVQAACSHLRTGGDLATFPEGTSEWGHRPQRYHRGAARIVAELAEEGVDVEVVPVGLFYSAPDRYRSRAEVWCGPPVTVPARGGRDRRDWEDELHRVFSEALDEVSVNCPDEETFEQVQRAAGADARSGMPFARSFLERQRAGAGSGDAGGSGGGADAPAWPRVLGLALHLAFAPVLLLAWFAGTRADARNTVTFFRMIGGLAVALVWVPTLAVIAVWQPVPVLVGVLAAVAGWALLGVGRWRL